MKRKLKMKRRYLRRMEISWRALCAFTFPFSAAPAFSRDMALGSSAASRLHSALPAATTYTLSQRQVSVKVAQTDGYATSRNHEMTLNTRQGHGSLVQAALGSKGVAKDAAILE